MSLASSSQRHDGGWRDALRLRRAETQSPLSRTLTGGEALASISRRRIWPGNGRLHPGRQLLSQRGDREIQCQSRRHIRDAYASPAHRALSHELSESCGLSVRPYARHSRMDFCSTFWSASRSKTTARNRWASSRPFDITAFTDTHLLAGLDLEYCERVSERDTGRARRPTAHRPRTQFAPRASTTTTRSTAQLPPSTDRLISPSRDRVEPRPAACALEYVEYDYDNLMFDRQHARRRDQLPPAAVCTAAPPTARTISPM